MSFSSVQQLVDILLTAVNVDGAVAKLIHVNPQYLADTFQEVMTYVTLSHQQHVPIYDVYSKLNIPGITETIAKYGDEADVIAAAVHHRLRLEDVAQNPDAGDILQYLFQHGYHLKDVNTLIRILKIVISYGNLDHYLYHTQYILSELYKQAKKEHLDFQKPVMALLTHLGASIQGVNLAQFASTPKRMIYRLFDIINVAVDNDEPSIVIYALDAYRLNHLPYFSDNFERLKTFAKEMGAQHVYVSLLAYS